MVIKIKDYSQFTKYLVKKKDKRKLEKIRQKIREADLEEKLKEEDEEEEIIEGEEKPMILLVSDVHLGAFGNISKAFEFFIDEIINNEFNDFTSNLKAFIILGDFFDVMMAGCDDLIGNYTGIYEKLSKLQQMGVNVYFILGNHEIRVDGPYDSEFSDRKSELLQKFEKYSRNNQTLFNLLRPENFCQYIILRTIYNQETNRLNWELALFDSKENIHHNINESSPHTRINITEVNNDVTEGYKCLMAHGFQFESPERLKIASEVWKGCIEAYDIVKKVVFNFFWNIIFHTFREFIYTGYLAFKYFFKKLKLLGKKKRLRRDFMEEFNFRENIKKRWIKNYLKSLKKMRKIRYKIDNETYNKEIEKFLSKNEFSNIKDVIYGHTHRPQTIRSIVLEERNESPIIEQKTMMKQAGIYERQESALELVKKAFTREEKEIPKGLIVNTGTWQIAMEMDRNPNIVGIYQNGEIKVFEGILNKTKIRILKLKLFS